jgi:hypothetical protein
MLPEQFGKQKKCWLTIQVSSFESSHLFIGGFCFASLAARIKPVLNFN